MTKIRTLQLLSLAVSTVFVGCAANETSMNAVLAPEPGPNLVFADTTQPTRDYPQSVSYIQNGDTAGEGSTGFRYRSADNIRYGLTPLAEPVVFAANVVTSPYTLIADRNDPNVSSGLQFPPTYTAMPPLPPENAPVAAEAPPAPPVEAGTATNVETAPSDPALSPATTTPAAVEHAENVPGDILKPAGGEPNAPSFIVAGQVIRPGTYSAKDLKLSQIVVAAGPSTEDATKVSVQIDRPGEESAKTTLDDLLTGKVEDISVKANDVITISVLP